MTLENYAAGAVEALEHFPEVLLPTQMDRGGRFALALGERRLLWAMLLDAAACFYKHRHARDNAGRKLFRDAERWLCDRNDPSAFSFPAVCDVLGLDAKQVRVGLLECVYGKIDVQMPPALTREEGRRGSERGPTQLRYEAGTRLAGGAGSPLRQARHRVGERRDTIARALSQLG
jgi:hypothetical protein